MILNHWGYANMGLTDVLYVSTGCVFQHEYTWMQLFFERVRSSDVNVHNSETLGTASVRS